MLPICNSNASVEKVDLVVELVYLMVDLNLVLAKKADLTVELVYLMVDLNLVMVKNADLIVELVYLMVVLILVIHCCALIKQFQH